MTLNLRCVCASVATACLLLPGISFAQAAGDEQYRDPFQDTAATQADSAAATTKAQQAQAETVTSTTGDALSDTPPSAPATTVPDTSDSAPLFGESGGGESETPKKEKADAKDKAALAQTGAETWLVGVGGFALLLLGGALRLRGGAERRH